jgi:hypothetical protein
LDKQQPKTFAQKNYLLAGITRKRVYMAAYMAHWYFGEKKKKKRDGGGILAMLLCFDGVCAQRNRSMWLVPQRTTLSLSDRQ